MPTEFDRARSDVLAYLLNDDRDLDGGAQAIEDLPFRQTVAIIDAVIRGLVTDPSIAYALAWAEAGGTPSPTTEVPFIPGPIPAADAEREARIDAGLFTGPLMVSVPITDLTEVLGLARHNAAMLATGHPSKEAFTRVDMAHTNAITPKAEWASGIAYTGDLAITAIVEAAEAIRRGVNDDEVLHHVGDLYAAAQGIRHTTHRIPDETLLDVTKAVEAGITQAHGPTGAHRLALASDYKATVRQHLHALYADLRASKLINLRVEVAADIVVTVIGTETDTITVTETVDVDDPPADPSLSMAAYDRLGDRVSSSGTAEHATPEVRAADAIDVDAVITTVRLASRWIEGRLIVENHAAGGPPLGAGYDIGVVMGSRLLGELDALAERLRDFDVDAVHRLAEAGGALAKAVDLIRAEALDGAGERVHRWTVSEESMRRLDAARTSWGHANRGLYAVPHPRFVERARGVAIAAGELGAFVERIRAAGFATPSPATWAIPEDSGGGEVTIFRRAG
jgi:hypothetical protein